MATGNVLIKDVRIVNRGEIKHGDVLIKDDRIEKIANSISVHGRVEEVNGHGLHLIPGVIDDQVHFREPGMEYKATIYSESRAGVAGGVTTFMEMPNTKPPATTQELLQQKYNIGEKDAWSNFSFFMGATNDNLDEVLKTDPETVCGIKAFMGSSTGNMLVDNPETLEKLFSQTPMLIATHCEDEATIKSNLEAAKEKYGSAIPPAAHPWIRSREACYISSSFAVGLAKKYNTRLHILHISTEEEVRLFDPGPLSLKRITSEACVHHMHFTDMDYLRLGNQIKCNPAIKTKNDKEAIWQGLLENRIDIIATDHAPHTWVEKQHAYNDAPSGLPLIQHSLPLMLNYVKQNKVSLQWIVEKMCHAPAECFRIKDRGYADEGYFADLVMVDVEDSKTVQTENILYKCGWSPLLHENLPGFFAGVWVNGNRVVKDGTVIGEPAGKRLTFKVT